MLVVLLLLAGCRPDPEARESARDDVRAKQEKAGRERKR